MEDIEAGGDILYRPENVITLERCLEEFVHWYNCQRLHQSLKYKTPSSVYFAG